MILNRRTTQPHDIQDYEQFLSSERYETLRKNALILSGKKVIHINATAMGGGVAEILSSLVPLQQSLGIDSQWYYIAETEKKFFAITKKIHNALQGDSTGLTQHEQEVYLKTSEKIAQNITELKPDVLVIHDPQPLSSASCCDVPKVLRIHPDLSKPNREVLDFLLPHFKQYDRIVFSMQEYVPEHLTKNRNIVISPPAIDPLAPKNVQLTKEKSKGILTDLGIDTTRPLITQVSRFDPWKDPIGVVDAFDLIKTKEHKAQLALVGIIEALDDPQQLEILRDVQERTRDMEDVYLFWQTSDMKSYDMGVFVNAFQSGSDIIMQKSLKEGFGLTVTEAMWKRAPVIGGNVGGITLQIEDGINGFLVSSVKEAAQRAIELLSDPEKRKTMGDVAHESVKKNFLINRFLEDELIIMHDMIISG